MPGNAKSLKRNNSGLTPNQVKFVHKFIKDPRKVILNPRAYGAGDRASKTGGHLASSVVLEAVATRMTPAEEITPEVIIANIVRISDLAEGSGMYLAALKAQELLGKYKGMWIEKHVNLNVDLAKSHVDALVEKMKQRKQLGNGHAAAAEILHLTSAGDAGGGPVDPFDGL